jgi:hypothetical protein
MNTDHDNELEAQVDRELKSLSSLTAPPTLATRIISAIAARADAPWYRRAWPTWPLAGQVASFALLIAMFGGLCFAGWQLAHVVSTTVLAQKVEGALAVASVVWRTLTVLGESVLEVIRHLGAGFVCAVVLVGVVGYALLLGLGSVCYRLALAPAVTTREQDGRQ